MTISHLEKCEFDYLRVTKLFVRKGNSTTTFSNAYKIRSVKKRLATRVQIRKALQIL